MPGCRSSLTQGQIWCVWHLQKISHRAAPGAECRADGTCGIGPRCQAVCFHRISAEDHREAEEASDGYEPCACDTHFLRSAASPEGNAGYAHQVSWRQTGRDGKRAHEEIRDLPAGNAEGAPRELDENDPRGEYVILVEGWNEDMQKEKRKKLPGRQKHWSWQRHFRRKKQRERSRQSFIWDGETCISTCSKMGTSDWVTG